MRYIVKPEDLKGEISDFPIEVVIREIKVLQINDGYIISYYGVLSEFIISDFREAVMFCRSIRIRQAMNIIRHYKERKYQNRYKRVY